MVQKMAISSPIPVFYGLKGNKYKDGGFIWDKRKQI